MRNIEVGKVAGYFLRLHSVTISDILEVGDCFSGKHYFCTFKECFFGLVAAAPLFLSSSTGGLAVVSL